MADENKLVSNRLAKRKNSHSWLTGSKAARIKPPAHEHGWIYAKGEAFANHKDAETQRRGSNSTNPHKLKCVERATKNRPGLEQRDYAGSTCHKLLFSTSSPNEERAGVRSRIHGDSVFLE